MSQNLLKIKAVQADPESPVDGKNSHLQAIPDELFGELFPKDQDPVDTAVAVIAAFCEGFAVEVGKGIGQANIDVQAVLMENAPLAQVAMRISSYASNPEDSEKMLGEAIPAKSKERSAKEARRSVAKSRAVIRQWKTCAELPRMARCDLPQDFGNVAEIIRTKIEPHLHLAGVFIRENKLVRVVPAKKPRVKNLCVSGSIVDMHDEHSLATDMSDVIAFTREKVKGRGPAAPYPIDPPADLVKKTLRLGQWPNVELLLGITSGPFMRPDGTVCEKNGFDHATGWFLDYDGAPIGVPDHPSKAEAETEAAILLDLIEEFEWADESQKAGWLAYLLTLVGKPGIIGNVPAFIFSATVPGAGKTLLASMANEIAYGRKPSGYNAPTGKEADAEWKKMLSSFAALGNPSLLIDNFPSGKAVGCAALDQVITSPIVIDRNLGRTKMQESLWVATVAVTGNNLGVGADFFPRTIWSVLEPTVEKPRERAGYRIPDLSAHIMEMRSVFLRAALTVLRWGQLEGAHHPTELKNFGSFERWQETVRFPIYHLLGLDVVQNGKDAVVADQEVDELATLIEGLSEYYEWRGQKPFLVSELFDDLSIHPTSWATIREVIDDSLPRKGFARTVSDTLKKHKGRLSNGKRITCVVNDKRTFWRIV